MTSPTPHATNPPNHHPLTIFGRGVISQIEGLKGIHPSQLGGKGLDLCFLCLQVAAGGTKCTTLGTAWALAVGGAACGAGFGVMGGGLHRQTRMPPGEGPATPLTGNGCLQHPPDRCFQSQVVGCCAATLLTWQQCGLPGRSAPRSVQCCQNKASRSYRLY